MSGAHPTRGCDDSRTWEFVIASDEAGKLSAQVYDVTNGQRRDLGAGISPSTGKVSTVIGPQAYLTQQGLAIRGTNDRSFDIWAPGPVVPLKVSRDCAQAAPEIAPAARKYLPERSTEPAGRRPKV